ncbi:DUF3987 domain-containing protein [Streptomyces chartreusis]|uniref:DUF3987 domain-containing protein n=1 Tax=Streptomyces chartreusis TaxID=1969 RepID=UPI002E80271D|nr:DUF3987 domain-containing protein [Streptomyces chartreusis]WUB18328.1 YfjI family protein [Streptomyces chartreusis]
MTHDEFAREDLCDHDQIKGKCMRPGCPHGIGTGAPQHKHDDAPESSPATRPWPVLADDAYYGLPGRIVEALLPHTEADPAALLFTLYAGAGAMIGRGPHVLAGGVEHGARIWPLIIGKTAGGMKGTSAAEVLRVLRVACTGHFGPDKILNGLSSAEGLIQCVRDGTGGNEEAKNYDPGVDDKRLLVIESEFASVLAHGKREGNTLLPVMRQAWDGGSLRTLTVNPRVATDPHIVVVGHITPTELRVKLRESERAGGTMNRFLPVMSKRSKKLANGGSLSTAALSALGEQLAAQVAKVQEIGQMTRSTSADREWKELYETRLTNDFVGDGPVAQVIARAAPQLLRLCALVALLDDRRTDNPRYIDIEHLRAAEALWSYAEDSAWYIFGDGTGNPDLDKLKMFVDAGPETGVTRRMINNECFGKHRTKAEIDALTVELIKLGGYEPWSAPTAGRPTTGLRRTKQI